MTASSLPRSIEWVGELDGFVRIIDQTKLPTQLLFLECHHVDTIHEAIRSLRVRGAPAIGIAAAMGVVLGVRQASEEDGDRAALVERVKGACDYLATARPTAVNLCWALARMRRVLADHSAASIRDAKNLLLREAKQIRDEDAAMCRRIGEIGEPLILPGMGVLTHCNAGALATAEYGTALAPLYLSHEHGKPFHVFVDETRPLLQGSRLTAWELGQSGIDVTLLTDSMAAALMKTGKVNLILTGADRIAANGDTANKIGTYGLAVLARHHEIPLYVAAPSSTFDLATGRGDDIRIEERGADEIRRGFGVLTAPEHVRCYSPAFDVTPAAFITGLITERGIIRPVTRERIAAVVGRG